MSAGIVDSTTFIACAPTLADSGEEVMRRVSLRRDAVASGRVPGVRPWSPGGREKDRAEGPGRRWPDRPPTVHDQVDHLRGAGEHHHVRGALGLHGGGVDALLHEPLVGRPDGLVAPGQQVPRRDCRPGGRAGRFGQSGERGRTLGRGHDGLGSVVESTPEAGSEDELLTAVDVVRRAREGGVGHEVNGERGDVRRADDAPDREPRAQLVAALVKIVAE